MKRWIFALIFMASCAPAFAQFGSFAEKPIEITAEGETRFVGGIAIAEDNVVIQFGDVRIYCDYAQYNPDTRDVLLMGRVRIYRGENVFTGERAVYNLETKELHAADFKGEYYPFRGWAESLSSAGAQE